MHGCCCFRCSHASSIDSSLSSMPLLEAPPNRFAVSCSLQHAGNPSYSTCAQGGIAAKPKAGDALLFYRSSK